jgi:hypothetical protein
MPNIKIKEHKKISPVTIKEIEKIAPVTIKEIEKIAPVTIEKIEKIAPTAVHIKELNHIDPLSVESLRIDEIRNLDPVSIERFNVTHLPTVNLSLSRLPALDLNIRRVPPVAIGVQQDFYLPSQYTVHAKLLGVEFLRLDIHGRTMVAPRDRRTMVAPRDRSRREQSRTHERSFPDVAAIGNPAIPTKRIETCVEAVTRAAPCGHGPAAAPRMRARSNPRGAQPHAPRRPGSSVVAGRHAGLNVGSPRFGYSISGPEATGSWGGGALSSGS